MALTFEDVFYHVLYVVHPKKKEKFWHVCALRQTCQNMSDLISYTHMYI
jgi:hypothetical protein